MSDTNPSDLKIDKPENTQSELIDLSADNISENVDDVVPYPKEKETKELEVNSDFELVGAAKKDEEDHQVSPTSIEEKKEDSLHPEEDEDGNNLSSPPLGQVTIKNEDLEQPEQRETLTKVLSETDKANVTEDNSIKLLTDTWETAPSEEIAEKELDHKQNQKKETVETPFEVGQLEEETTEIIVVTPTEIIAEPEPSLWIQEKEKCLNESIEERRKKRKCTELSSIETWPEYYNEYINKGTEKAEAEFPDISSKVSLWKGDITSLLIDAIVNAANETLLGGGGVDGAIHSAAGPLLREECSTFYGCAIGESVITGAYDLPAKYVIHTVGPRGENPSQLMSCYLKSLDHLINENQRTIAFPCISTGIFGYPNDNAANVVLKTLREWLEEHHEKVDRVIFCLFLEKDISIYEKKMQQYFPMLGGHTDENPSATARGSAEDEPSLNPTAVEDSNNATGQREGETTALISKGKKRKHWQIRKLLCCLKQESP